MNEVIFQVGMTLELIEKLAILKTLNHFRGNKMAAAGSLGIDRRTLDHRLEKYSEDEMKEKVRIENDESRRQELLRRARGNPPNNVGIPYSPSEAVGQASLLSSPPGLRMESTVKFASQPKVSMPQRQEVQNVLSSQASEGGKGKGR